MRILQSDSAQGKNRYLVLAGPVQSFKTGRAATSFRENWSEDNEICSGIGRYSDFLVRMAGDRNEPVPGIDLFSCAWGGHGFSRADIRRKRRGL